MLTAEPGIFFHAFSSVPGFLLATTKLPSAYKHALCAWFFETKHCPAINFSPFLMLSLSFLNVVPVERVTVVVEPLVVVVVVVIFILTLKPHTSIPVMDKYSFLTVTSLIESPTIPLAHFTSYH